MKRLAMALLAPVVLCGMMPAAAGAAELCGPMETALTTPSAAAAMDAPAGHGCCGPAAVSGIAGPATPPSERGTASPLHENHSHPAPAHAGANCSCQPADLPERQESETPAVTPDTGIQRAGFAAPDGMIPPGHIPDNDPGIAIRCPDLARRFASSPPLYLLNDTLLI